MEEKHDNLKYVGSLDTLSLFLVGIIGCDCEDKEEEEEEEKEGGEGEDKDDDDEGKDEVWKKKSEILGRIMVLGVVEEEEIEFSE